MIRRSIPKVAHIALGILSVAVLVMCYSVLSERLHALNQKNTVMPSINQMAKAFIRYSMPDPDTRKIQLINDLTASGYRYFLALGIASVISVVLGILMGCYQIIEGLLIVPLSVAAKTPPTAMMVIFMVLAGTDIQLFLILIGFGIIPVLTQVIFQSVKYDVPNELIEKTYTLGGTDCEIIMNTIFRQTLPRIIEAIRLQMGPAMIYLIAAELSLADVGLGYTINLQGKKQNMEIVYPYCLLLALIGLFFDYGLIKIRQWLCPWFEKA